MTSLSPVLPLRAKTTAELFVTEYDRKLKEILYVPSLYHADPDIFYEVVGKLDDAYDHVALFSHNPGITDFASSLTTCRDLAYAHQFCVCCHGTG